MSRQSSQECAKREEKKALETNGKEGDLSICEALEKKKISDEEHSGGPSMDDNGPAIEPASAKPERPAKPVKTSRREEKDGNVFRGVTFQQVSFQASASDVSPAALFTEIASTTHTTLTGIAAAKTV